jgi:MATE family multidrug resistance protein
MTAPATTYSARARSLLALGLPLVGSHLAQVAIGVTDAVMLGWYDVAALAAVTLSHSMWFVLFILGSGFAFAVLPMVASALGEGDETQVRRVTRMGMWISVLFGLVAMVPLAWPAPLLRALGQPAETVSLSGDYLRIAAFALVPALLVMVLKSYLSALERTRAVLWITVGTAVLNLGVNWLLIFGNWGFPELGVRGAAVASLSVQLGGLAAMVAYCRRVTPEHALFTRLWRVDAEAFGRVFRLGWPIGLTLVAEVSLFSAAAVMMGWLGALPLAAHGVAVQLSSLTFVVHLGLSQAATVRAGLAHGRRDMAELRRLALTVIALSTGLAAVSVVIFVAWPEALAALFVDPADPERPAIIRLGATLLLVAAVFQLVDALQVVALGLLRGLHDTRWPMVYASVSYWLVGLPVAWVLGFGLGWGGPGVWAGLAAGLGLAAVLLMSRFWRQLRPAG